MGRDRLGLQRDIVGRDRLGLQRDIVYSGWGQIRITKRYSV